VRCPEAEKARTGALARAPAPDRGRPQGSSRRSNQKLAALLLLLAACGSGASSAATDADLSLCVDELNRYRAMAGKPALTRSASLEAYALAGAAQDGMAGVPHVHFRSDDAPVAAAENEFPFQSLSGAGSIANLIRSTTAAVWSENQTSAARATLLGPFTQVGCGVFQQRDEVTLVEDFR
jgi:hypothetical protein